MGDELQTAVVFTANLIESKNIVFLIPQQIIIGKCSEDTSYFYSYLDGLEYQNADDAVREEKNISFYDVKTIKTLKEIYGLEDLYDLFQKYMNDLYTKVYYYQIGNNNSFENYFMKRCSIEEFNNKFDLNFTYDYSSNKDEEEIDDEVDIVTKNFKNIKHELDKSILFQNKAKDKLISILYNNSVTNGPKSNIIISGPSGVGKSAMLRLLADSSNQSVLYTKYTPELIDDAEEYLNELLMQAYYIGLSKNDTKSFTIIIDDFDKNLEFCTNMEVIDSLTHFFKNGKKFVPYQSGGRQGLIFDPEQVTFIICGNFNGVKKEVEIPTEFFTGDNISINDIPETLNKRELIDGYGFSDEALESFDTFIDFQPLTLAKTKKILTNANNSLFNVYCRKLKKQGIIINIDDKTIDLICEKVYSKKTNIKNMDNVISNVFKDIMVETLLLDEKAEITISDETVKDHSKYTLKKSSKK